MRAIFGARQCGKTTKLIEMSSVSGAYILCLNIERRKYIVELADKLGAKIPYPLTVDDIRTKNYYGKGIGKIYIDEVDDVVSTILGVGVGAISFTEK